MVPSKIKLCQPVIRADQNSQKGALYKLLFKSSQNLNTFRIFIVSFFMLLFIFNWDKDKEVCGSLIEWQLACAPVWLRK
jgi:hypothetical protein